MAKTTKSTGKNPGKKTPRKKVIEKYEHKGKKRANNPPVGLVTPETDKPAGRKTYEYDPHLDPELQWAGKAEHTSFKVPTVSLHVHERIDPRTIIEAVRKKNGKSGMIAPAGAPDYESATEEEKKKYAYVAKSIIGPQISFFETKEENLPLRDAIEFYKHKKNWTNRLIAGDSLLVMNSMLEKEGLGGQVQMVYIDPPYGIKYGSNFQPFVNKRDVKDRKDEDLTSEPEMIKAFRDTWELGIHSYLSYLRDRLLLAKELLTESGSCFVQISDENVHLVRSLMDEVFGVRNCVAKIKFYTRSNVKGVDESIADNIVWFAKDINQVKIRPLYIGKASKTVDVRYRYIELTDGSRRSLTKDEIEGKTDLPMGNRRFSISMLSSKSGGRTSFFPYEYKNQTFYPQTGRYWSTTKEGLDNLAKSNRLYIEGKNLKYKLYLDDFGLSPLSNIWNDTVRIHEGNLYTVQTGELTVTRCLLMATDPGDLVFDPTCGSGTTAHVAEQWGRRWITCDTSRVATTLAKQRLMTSLFDYYELAHPDEGIGSGLRYKIVPHITLGSIANNEPPGQETLYDQPFTDKSKARVTGPFTVEAVPAPMVKPLTDIKEEPVSDESVVRSGETLRQDEWRSELLKTGIRGKGGQRIEFSRVEPLPGTRWLHADGETKAADIGSLDDVWFDTGKEMSDGKGGKRRRTIKPKSKKDVDDYLKHGYKPLQRVVVSFGPEYAPLEQRQVALAIEEAQTLVPRPKIIVFASLQFDPEAAKDIDELNWPGVTLLKAQMNADLFTEDLKKKRASNESFWLIGQPDVRVEKIKNGDDKGKYRVEVHGFDYYNTRSGTIDSGGTEKIAMWMLDTDYDGRSLFARQVFFPMSGEKDGWSRLKRNLKAEIDEELIEAYRGTVSLPFEPGENKRVAVKIVDDRGIESLKIVDVE